MNKTHLPTFFLYLNTKLYTKVKITFGLLPSLIHDFTCKKYEKIMDFSIP